MKVVLKAKVLELYPDTRKPNEYRLSAFQEGDSNLIKISGIPSSEVSKFKQGEESSILIDTFVFRPADGGAFQINKFVQKLA